MSSDDDFDDLMKELDADVPAPKPAAAPAPARRGKKSQTVITDDATDPQPALAAKMEADKPADDGFVKIAGLANQQPESVKVTVVEDAPQQRAYMSPQTLAEIEAGKAVLNRFK
jgi:hypothetical protein